MFTSVLGFGLCIALGLDGVASVYVAVALTFSCTIIIVKLLTDKREIDSLHGRIAVGFLIVQDIVIVLAMIVLVAWNAGKQGEMAAAEVVWVLVPRYRRVPNVATAEDRVQRQFERNERDQLWVTDITEHPTREGKVYCAVVLDAFSRRIVGWWIDAQPAATLQTNALGMAIEQRRPPEGATVIHSDQGTQFTSWAFTKRAVDSGLLPSMGSVGDCYDNAMIESFWSRMQVELLNRRR